MTQYRIVEDKGFHTSYRVEKLRRFLFFEYWSLVWDDTYSTSIYSSLETAKEVVEYLLANNTRRVVETYTSKK